MPTPAKGLTPAQRKLRAQLAAHTRWSRADGVEGTAKARQVFLDRFEHEVDPDGVLAPEERARRAANARSAYFAKLSLKAARARQAKAAS